ncbi:MAG: hypothetical protein BWY74_01695 [Firmicutes bacterium ADurb.Bin419]|nr:MAG: hypothetical protein BWY74_01695 [Firmicutes bacterium ADurb.Bin419]
MVYNDEVYSTLFPLMRNFLYHYLSYKELIQAYKSLPGDSEFWVYTCDAHLQMASITWCMVFGDNSNEPHWKNLELNEDEFRSVLFRECQIDENDWKEYWNTMRTFRNKYVAHRELNNFNDPVPFLDLAYKAVIILDLWIRDQISPDINENEPFNCLAEVYNKNIKSTIRKVKKRKCGKLLHAFK